MSAARKLLTADTPRPASTPGRMTPASAAVLYDTHLHVVWRNLRRLGVPAEAIEDAAQDVFVAVHRRLHTYDPAASSVDTWLFGIVIRVVQYHRRSLRRRVARLVRWFQERPIDDISTLHNPAEIVAKREAVRVLDQILSELPEEQREVLVLVDVEQLSVPEAASVLVINVNTAYTRLRSARLRFQRAIDQLRAAEQKREGGNGT
jgi:RNA polymerase sigma-70 factor (ECF subfamily)